MKGVGCPNCGSEVQVGVRSCPTCGSEIVSETRQIAILQEELTEARAREKESNEAVGAGASMALVGFGLRFLLAKPLGWSTLGVVFLVVGVLGAIAAIAASITSYSHGKRIKALREQLRNDSIHTQAS